MKTQRITVSIPTYIYDQLKPLIKDRGLSGFVADAVQERVLVEQHKIKADPVENFLKWKGKMPKRSTKQILDAIHKGRK